MTYQPMPWTDIPAAIKACEWDMHRAINSGDTLMADVYKRQLDAMRAYMASK